jgi:predicted lipoprotein with Yx(FWY)xxD motif
MSTTSSARLARRLLAAATITIAGSAAVIASSPNVGAQTTPTTTAAAAKAPAIKLADSRLGRILVDGDGLSLYMFVPDRPNVSNCEGQCLVAWPPVLLPAGKTLSDIDLGDGLRRVSLGIAMRENGTRQITYNGWPLYYWFRDTKPGDVLGQWVNNIWFVINDTGVPITPR